MKRADVLSRAEVQELQRLLRGQHYIVGPLDGLVGRYTQRAILTYEQDVGRERTGTPSRSLLLELRGLPPRPMDAPQGLVGFPAALHVELERKAVTLFSRDEFYGIFAVAIGKLMTPSPFGRWQVRNKAVNPGGPFGARWMGLDVPWGSYGVHGTNNPDSIGKQVSNGCIRMFNSDVVEVFAFLEVGSPVLLTGNPYGLAIFRRELKIGDMGSDVYLVQQWLFDHGWMELVPDGIFGKQTEAELRKYQQGQGLPVHGRFDRTTMKAMFGE